MSKILLISDNPIGASQRGCEANDQIIVDNLNCDFATSEEFNKNPRTNYDKIIISNFFFLSEESKEILKNANCYHCSHDFLFASHRIPSLHPDFIVPAEYKVNVDFLNSFKKIYCQSSFQADIFRKNGFENVESWQGNLWRADDIDNMCALNGPKNGRAAIIAGQHKGEEQSADLAKKLNIPFDILPPMPYSEFLITLSQYQNYLYIPVILESLCRVIFEAKLMGVVPLTTNLCGGVYTSLWNYNCGELAAKLHLKREEILKKLKED